MLLARSQVITADADGSMSFEDFYRLYVDRIHRVLAITLGDHHLAREATDEAMARAFLHWRKVSDHSNPGGWVYRVGLNWAMSWWRKFGRERPVAEPLPTPNASTDPDKAFALQLVRSLPPPQRAVVVCRVLLDLSTQETAATLGIAEGTVKSRLSRSLEALRATYEETEQ